MMKSSKAIVKAVHSSSRQPENVFATAPSRQRGFRTEFCFVLMVLLQLWWFRHSMVIVEWKSTETAEERHVVKAEIRMRQSSMGRSSAMEDPVNEDEALENRPGAYSNAINTRSGDSEDVLKYFNRHNLGCMTDNYIQRSPSLAAPCGHHRCFFPLPTNTTDIQGKGFLVALATAGEVEDMWRSWNVAQYLANTYEVPLLAQGPPTIVGMERSSHVRHTGKAEKWISEDFLQCLNGRRMHSNVKVGHRMPDFINLSTNATLRGLVVQVHRQVPEPNFKFQCNSEHIEKELKQNLLPLVQQKNKAQHPPRNDTLRDQKVTQYWKAVLEVKNGSSESDYYVKKLPEAYLGTLQLEIQKAKHVLERESYLAKGFQSLIDTNGYFYYIDIAHGRGSNAEHANFKTNTTNSADKGGTNVLRTTKENKGFRRKVEKCQAALDQIQDFLVKHVHLTDAPN